jgi:glycosyltransferase involved in cell wall biosynthesis
VGRPVIAFIERETAFSGKVASTRNLVAGIEGLGSSAIAAFYAATCLEDAALLADVPPERRVIWLRGNPASPGTIRVPEGGGRWIATSHQQAEDRREQFGEVFVLPEAIKLPPESEVNAVEPASRKGLLFVGRADRSKGLPILLNALRGLPPEEFLTVIGPYPSNMPGLATALEVDDRVAFLGYLENDRLKAHYFSAKFLLAPCQNEPFGMPVVEALAHGCTPIAVAGSGGPDEVLGGTPYLVPPSPQDFARAVLNCVSMEIEASVAMAQFASHQVVAEKFLEFLDE